jgi:hypothetical protein
MLQSPEQQDWRLGRPVHRGWFGREQADYAPVSHIFDALFYGSLGWVGIKVSQLKLRSFNKPVRLAFFYYKFKHPS